MELRTRDGSIAQTDPGYPLSFSPATASVSLLETDELTDATSMGDRFDVRDFAEDLEMRSLQS